VRPLIVLWVVIGVLSVAGLVFNLADDGWDFGVVGNVAMIAASVTGVIVQRERAREEG
jgi:hypothetical protein